MTRGLRPGLLAIVLLVFLCGCSGSAGATGAPSPAGSGLASPGEGSGIVTVSTAADAASRVLSQIGRWPGLGPFDPNKIGQCCGYRVQQTADGWSVTIEVGWGDCPAGCINRHQWRYGVHPDGTIVDLGEVGPAVPAGLPGAETAGGSPEASTPPPSLPPMSGPGVRGIALAGPTCPVSRPNDPACADRPVARATIHVVAADGTEVATVTTDGTGRFQVPLEAGGYRLVADPVTGLMGTAKPVDVTVTSGVVDVQLSYDTGIR